MKISEARSAGYIHRKDTQRSSKEQVAVLHLRPCLVRYCVERNRTIRDCWKLWCILTCITQGTIDVICLNEEHYTFWNAEPSNISLPRFQNQTRIMQDENKVSKAPTQEHF